MNIVIVTGLCLKHIEVMLRVKENEKKKGLEQPQ